MARSKDGSTRYSAVLEYIKSFNEIEREMYERIKKMTRKQKKMKLSESIPMPIIPLWRSVNKLPKREISEPVKRCALSRI